MGCAVTVLHDRAIGRLSREKLLQQHPYYVLELSFNGESATFSLESWRIVGLPCDIVP